VSCIAVADIQFSLTGTAALPRPEVVTTCLFMAQPMHGAYSSLFRDIGYLRPNSDDNNTPARNAGKSKKSRFKMHMHPQHHKSYSPP
jgi:hypothetical protein